MGMPWVRLDSAFSRNHKVLALLGQPNGHRRVAIYTFALGHSGEGGLDGFIPREALPLIHAKPADMAALVEVALVQEIAGGWVIPDWSEYQPTSAETAARSQRAKEAAAKRWSKHNASKATGNAEGNATGMPDALPNAMHERTNVLTDDPSSYQPHPSPSDAREFEHDKAAG